MQLNYFSCCENKNIQRELERFVNSKLFQKGKQTTNGRGEKIYSFAISVVFRRPNVLKLVIH